MKLGVEWITTGGPGSPTYSAEGRVERRPSDTATAPWKEVELRQMQERATSFGLKIGNIMLHDFHNAILGRPGALMILKKFANLFVLRRKWKSPLLNTIGRYALRAMGGYYEMTVRSDTVVGAHEYDPSRNLPALPNIGTHSAADLWSRYERFPKAVVPVAERAGVRLAVHPNDPSPPRYRGIEQILASVDGLKRVCEIVKSPANGITLDTGVTRENGRELC